MNAQLVESVHALGQDEQLETVEAILGGLTLGTVVKLVPRLEKAWDVEAHQKVSGGTVLPHVEEEEVEQTAFSVFVDEIGPQKIQVVKAVRQFMDVSLKEAKDLLDAALPALIKKDLAFLAAEELKKVLTETGAKVSIK